MLPAGTLIAKTLSTSSLFHRPQLSIATAIVFYHRFYARESYEHYERFQAN